MVLLRGVLENTGVCPGGVAAGPTSYAFVVQAQFSGPFFGFGRGVCGAYELRGQRRKLGRVILVLAAVCDPSAGEGLAKNTNVLQSDLHCASRFKAFGLHLKGCSGFLLRVKCCESRFSHLCQILMFYHVPPGALFLALFMLCSLYETPLSELVGQVSSSSILQVVCNTIFSCLVQSCLPKSEHINA